MCKAALCGDNAKQQSQNWSVCYFDDDYYGLKAS